MQVTLPIHQARPNVRSRDSWRRGVRHLAALAGELMALASLVTALVAGLTVLAGLP